MNESGSDGKAIRLNSLGGAEAPGDLPADLKLLSALPGPARERFWDVLFPALAEPLSPSAAQALDGFVRAFGLAEDMLACSIRSCRYLVREAAFRNVSRKGLEDDIVKLLGGPLSPDAVVIAPLLLSRYEEAKEALRGPCIEASIRDHGALLESVEWRVDTVISSSRADGISARVFLLTLGFSEGGRGERITLQLSPQKLQELKRACEMMSR